MTSQRLRKLNDIGFDFEPVETRWKRNLELVYEYKITHGHWNIAKSYSVGGINLVAFLQRQVRQYRIFQNGRKSPMTKERIDQFRMIGFDLDQPPVNLWGRGVKARHKTG